MEDDAADGGLLTEAAWAVYAVPPADFVATRKEWVARLRAAGQRDQARTVGALRKPGVSAAAVNALVRAEDPVVGRLRDLGSRMRHAQSALDVAGLAALRGERDALLADWVAAAREHAPGEGLTPAVEAEVRDTAVAALADAAATEVVLSGTLTRTLSYSGFGEVDVADAVARTSTGVVLTRIEGGAGAGAGARVEAGGPAEIESTEADEVDTGEPVEVAEAGKSVLPDDGEPAPDEESDDPGEADDAEAEATQARHAAEVERLREELDAVEAEVTGARTARRAAADAADRAEQGVTVAQKGLDQARRLLAQAERHAADAEQAHEAATADLAEADAELETARRRRDDARAALEEAEDA